MTNVNPNELYRRRGVSADKEDVHAAIKNIDKGLYPQAFCTVSYTHLTLPTTPYV